MRGKNSSEKKKYIYHRRVLEDGHRTQWIEVPLQPNESYRFIIAKSSPNEVGVEIELSEQIESNIMEIFDRAFFPVETVEEHGLASNDITPDAGYDGQQKMYDMLIKEFGKKEAEVS